MISCSMILPFIWIEQMGKTQKAADLNRVWSPDSGCHPFISSAYNTDYQEFPQGYVWIGTAIPQ